MLTSTVLNLPRYQGSPNYVHELRSECDVHSKMLALKERNALRNNAAKRPVNETEDPSRLKSCKLFFRRLF